MLHRMQLQCLLMHFTIFTQIPLSIAYQEIYILYSILFYFYIIPFYFILLCFIRFLCILLYSIVFYKFMVTIINAKSAEGQIHVQIAGKTEEKPSAKDCRHALHGTRSNPESLMNRLGEGERRQIHLHFARLCAFVGQLKAYFPRLWRTLILDMIFHFPGRRTFSLFSEKTWCSVGRGARRGTLFKPCDVIMDVR